MCYCWPVTSLHVMYNQNCNCVAYRKSIVSRLRCHTERPRGIKHLPMETAAGLLALLNTPSNYNWQCLLVGSQCGIVFLSATPTGYWVTCVMGLGCGGDGMVLKVALYQWEACGLSTPSPGQQWELDCRGSPLHIGKSVSQCCLNFVTCFFEKFIAVTWDTIVHLKVQQMTYKK